MSPQEWIETIVRGKSDASLSYLYGDGESIIRQRQRYLDAIREFQVLFPERKEIALFSAPGRTEIGGNHTDHQHGCVLAAAVDLDVIAVVAFHDEDVIRLKSKGYPMDTVTLDDLSIQKSETGRSAGIIRGMAAKFAAAGVKPTGFDAYTTSDVLKGSGISSSAAFEVLLGTIFNCHNNMRKTDPVEIAMYAQYAENVYFGKASGLMDQMVSSVGGFVWIDFKNAKHPDIRRYDVDFAKAGYTLCITDTKGDHANLTEDYVAIPEEMQQVANYFGKTVLRDVQEAAFYDAIPALRQTCSDRAILRAAHFFAETKRATDEANALANGDMETFLRLVHASGESSANLLQNLYPCRDAGAQAIPLAIMMSRRILQDTGAVRVHGGGFAGTIQAFVPQDQVDAYRNEMERLFGTGSCHIMRIRPVGGVELTKHGFKCNGDNV